MVLASTAGHFTVVKIKKVITISLYDEENKTPPPFLQMVESDH